MRTCPHCGNVGKKRSTPAHRRFFKMIEIAYQNWPETHEFQPASSEELRKWAQMAVGYRYCAAQIPIDGLDASLVLDVVRGCVAAADGDYVHVVSRNGQLYLWRSRSIAYSDLGQAESNRLFSDVEAFIRSETGIQFERYMEAA